MTARLSEEQRNALRLISKRIGWNAAPGYRSQTLNSLRRRGLVRMREILVMVREFGVGETCEREFNDAQHDNQYIVTAAGAALVAKGRTP